MSIRLTTTRLRRRCTAATCCRCRR